ncbi:hypothetical protein [Modestobacter altitudinis]|uniref:hypothetical protein n=1 Tax=Modestobacter altitudinis TaxID=2213158 RepID=UPI0015D4699D|nr:hypothetical protein [Modestobacter altitudinis]
MWPQKDDRSWTKSRPPGGGRRRSGWAVAVDGDRSAALLLRIWRDDGARSFRGRMTSMDTWPMSAGEELATVGLAASPRDVMDAVRAWLDEFLGDAPMSIDGDDRAPAVHADGAGNFRAHDTNGCPSGGPASCATPARCLLGSPTDEATEQ